MENANVLKTAVGVGILGTLAVYLGYSYFNEDSHVTSTLSDSIPDSPTTNSVSAEVAQAIAEKKSAFSTFFASAYKTLNTTEDIGEKLNNDLVSN
tara:strand:+ start:5440 stop:5724 length:285 start_codon:yes stop_codon:yes gene_type:complete